jgi:membrane protein implicated in regulation of membrane protease activity
MSDSRPPASPSRGLWILITILLIPPVVLPLWVPLYDKVDPRLNGWPFFYWFQMALILFSTAMTVVAFAVSRIADRKDREARGQTRGPARDQKRPEDVR